MDLSPLIYDKNGKLRAIYLRRGPHAEKMFTAELIVCANPLCECEDVTLRCVRTDREAGARPARIDVVLDLEQRRAASSAGGKRLTAESLSLAGGLVNELGAADWQDLYERFYLSKQAQTEEADCRELSAAFPPENLSDPSLMIGYKDILPWGSTFDFKLEQEHWLLDDQYCVNPECDCEDAIITFLRTTITSDGRGKVAQQMPPARYQADCDVFEPIHPPWTDAPPLKTLAGALRAAHPTLVRDIRKRRQQLRTLFEAALKRDRPKRPVPPVERRAVRPNDQCPCGSGRKYKKCCGRLA